MALKSGKSSRQTEIERLRLTKLRADDQAEKYREAACGRGDSVILVAPVARQESHDKAPLNSRAECEGESQAGQGDEYEVRARGTARDYAAGGRHVWARLGLRDYSIGHAVRLAPGSQERPRLRVSLREPSVLTAVEVQPRPHFGRVGENGIAPDKGTWTPWRRRPRCSNRHHDAVHSKRREYHERQYERQKCEPRDLLGLGRQDHGRGPSHPFMVSR